MATGSLISQVPTMCGIPRVSILGNIQEKTPETEFVFGIPTDRSSRRNEIVSHVQQQPTIGVVGHMTLTASAFVFSDDGLSFIYFSPPGDTLSGSDN